MTCPPETGPGTKTVPNYFEEAEDAEEKLQARVDVRRLQVVEISGDCAAKRMKC